MPENQDNLLCANELQELIEPYYFLDVEVQEEVEEIEPLIESKSLDIESQISRVQHDHEYCSKKIGPEIKRTVRPLKKVCFQGFK